MSYVDVVIATTEDLNIMIQSRNGGVDAVEYSASQTANSHPSPVSRSVTSTTREANDRLRVEGWVRQFRCNGVTIDTLDYAARFKRTLAAQKYTSAAFAVIYCPIGVFRNMRIADFTVSVDGSKAEEMYFAATWESVNLAGGTLSPGFVGGGLTL